VKNKEGIHFPLFVPLFGALNKNAATYHNNGMDFF